MNGREAKLLSNIVVGLHLDNGGGVTRLADMQPLTDEESAGLMPVDGLLVDLEGPILRARKDVRRLLYDAPEDVKEDPRAAVWSVYDEEEGKSYVGMALLRSDE